MSKSLYSSYILYINIYYTFYTINFILYIFYSSFVLQMLYEMIILASQKIFSYSFRFRLFSSDIFLCWCLPYSLFYPFLVEIVFYIDLELFLKLSFVICIILFCYFDHSLNGDNFLRILLISFCIFVRNNWF